MKRLIVVRHAKTEQSGYGRDFLRELTDSGKADAWNVANDLKERNIFPDGIISSPATRALTTARIFSEVLEFPQEKIVEEKGLYFDFTTQNFVDMVQEVPDEIETLFVFGHNPFIYYAAGNMCRNFYGDMPTCSTVVIDFDISSWGKAEPRKGNLLVHLYPKLYN
ncbi:MAG TPA: histidine phosphatase family protein [Prolixibacteraceae bacterium]|nr:histidine phosphatase family protein [Prolixibacteraceae bacterium]